MTATEDQKAKDRFLSAHTDMVNWFMKRSLNEHVQSTFDLMKLETQAYVRDYEA